MIFLNITVIFVRSTPPSTFLHYEKISHRKGRHSCLCCTLPHSLFPSITETISKHNKQHLSLRKVESEYSRTSLEFLFLSFSFCECEHLESRYLNGYQVGYKRTWLFLCLRIPNVQLSCQKALALILHK